MKSTAKTVAITLLCVFGVIVLGWAIFCGLFIWSLESMASDKIGNPDKVIKNINDDWGADIPKGYTVKFAFKDTGFDGGEYYLVLEYESLPEEFCSRMETQPSGFVENFINGNLTDYSRDDREMPAPDWESGYLWKYFRELDNSLGEHSDELYLVYSPTHHLLYVYLDFSQYSGIHEVA